MRPRQKFAAGLEALFLERGLPCEIEPGVSGVIVYASTRGNADRIAREILESAKTKDPRASSDPANFDRDEAPDTSWWASVNFSWERIEA